MAPEQVGILETELGICLDEIKELQRARDEREDHSFSDSEMERWNRLNKEVDSYKTRIEQAKVDKRMAELEGIAQHSLSTERAEGAGFQIQRAGAYGGGDPFDLTTIERSFDPEKEGQQWRDRAHKVVSDRMSFRASPAKSDLAKEHVTNLIDDVDPTSGALSRHVVVNGSDRYKRAFGKAIGGGFLNSEDAKMLEMSRALSLTGAAGGFAVPTELDPTIIPTSNYTVNPFRAISRVIPITTDNWNGVSAGAAAASYAAEATPTTDSSPTLAQITISTEKASSFIPFSIEIDQDWGQMQAEMGRLLRDAKDVLEATKFTLGTGTNEPAGIITGATVLFTAASTTALSVTDLFNLELALPARFRQNASMLFTRAVAQKIRGFDAGITSGAGSAVWIDNLRQPVSNNAVGAVTGGYNANVLGYPAFESVDMSSTFTTGQKLIVYGDFEKYIIIDRIGMNIETIPMLFDVTFNQPTGQRGLYAYWRNGAKVASASAFVTLRLA